MIDTKEKECLVGAIRRLARTLNALESKPSGHLLFYGPSRHLVVRSDDGTTVAKSYTDQERWRDEIANLKLFLEINESRSKLLQEINSSDTNYIGLPTIDPRLDISRMDVKTQNGTPISIFSAVQGDLLYDKTMKGIATVDDYMLAAIQVARIQEEGKIHREKLGLEDVIRKKGGEPDTLYFLNRFQNVFLGQLMTYGGINIPAPLQQEMAIDWESLVAESLVRAHNRGYNGYYYDGNPRHHILNSDRRGIVSLDFEYRISLPALLGLASLLSFGLSKEAAPYLSKDDQSKILDRALLEIEFVDTLRRGAKDKAERIVKYVAERKVAYDSDLSGEKSDDFYRFLGDGDKGIGKMRREEFLSAWPYALLERHAAWLGHKARYKAVAEFLLQGDLFKEEGIKFETEDPVRQNAIEQRQHLDHMLLALEQLQDRHKRNGKQGAVIGLYNRFKELSTNPYFSQN